MADRPEDQDPGSGRRANQHDTDASAGLEAAGALEEQRAEADGFGHWGRRQEIRGTKESEVRTILFMLLSL